jgi:hypothetical protein
LIGLILQLLPVVAEIIRH